MLLAASSAFSDEVCEVDAEESGEGRAHLIGSPCKILCSEEGYSRNTRA